MHPLDPSKPLPPHYNLSQFSVGTRPRSFCGCFAIGCGGILLLLAIACGSGWYVLLHTAIPLQMVVGELERSGDFNIEGLRGSLASGVEADEIRFRSNQLDTTEWSNLKKLKIKYQLGWRGFFGSADFVVDEISVEGGTIYGRLEASVGDEDLDLLGFLEPLQNVMDEVSRGGDGGQGSLRIKRILLADLTFIDPQTDTEFHIDEIRLDELLVSPQAVFDFKDLAVHIDGLDITTEPSQRPGAQAGDKRITGRVHPGFGRRVEKEFVFHIDFSTRSGHRVDYFADWFGSKVIVDSWKEPGFYHIQIKDFSPAEYFSFHRRGAIPAAIALDLVASSRPPHMIQSIERNGSFRLGRTTFSEFAKHDADQAAGPASFTANATVAGQTIRAHVHVLSKLPLLEVKLDPGVGWSLEDTWSRVLFDLSYEELSAEQQSLVKRSLGSEAPAVAPEAGEQPGTVEDDGGASVWEGSELSRLSQLQRAFLEGF